MRAEVIKETSNKFLKRKELVVEIENPEEPTPSKATLQHLIAKQLGTAVEHIEVIDIVPSAGMPKSVSNVFVWDDKRVKDLTKKEEVKEESKPEGQTAATTETA